MGKRKRGQSAGPTLFDLPMRSGGGEPESAKDAGEPALAPDVASRPAAGQGPSILFDDDEPAGDDDPQLDFELKPQSSRQDGPRDEPREDVAFLGDRLLGGLADLAAQLLMLGLAIASTHALDVVVTVADWMPFGVLALVFSFLYWVMPLAFWGQTPGMAWVGHTARSSSGEPLSFGQTFRRWFGAILTLALAGLPLLLALTGRSLTDRISDSRTVAG